MSGTLRSLMRRLRRSEESTAALRETAAPQAASRGLRQRVLGAARGEAGAESRASAHSQRVRTVAIVILAALAVGVTSVLELGSADIHDRGARVVIGAHRMRASLRRSGAHVELLVSRMREPPIGEVYEVWLIRAHSAPQPTDALFTVTSAGNGSVEVPGGLRGVREVMVTSEPLGGSSSPTSAAVLRVPAARLG
jgi:hypothetical protein